MSSRETFSNVLASTKQCGFKMNGVSAAIVTVVEFGPNRFTNEPRFKLMSKGSLALN